MLPFQSMRPHPAHRSRESSRSLQRWRRELLLDIIGYAKKKPSLLSGRLLIPFGIEITSPPLVDGSETTRNTAIQIVLDSRVNLQLDKDGNPGAPMVFSIRKIFIDWLNQILPRRRSTLIHLTAPGIHVHVGAGIEEGAKLEELAVKNIAFLM
ncbi:hypothetical protein BDZ89DRAFT_660153 [Hymenopellis radicata]|nr:hypothetical protein BDZ89DRAFT_660153 [Hymenopellis radicata]